MEGKRLGPRGKNKNSNHQEGGLKTSRGYSSGGKQEDKPCRGRIERRNAKEILEKPIGNSAKKGAVPRNLPSANHNEGRERFRKGRRFLEPKAENLKSELVHRRRTFEKPGEVPSGESERVSTSNS